MLNCILFCQFVNQSIINMDFIMGSKIYNGNQNNCIDHHWYYLFPAVIISPNKMFSDFTGMVLALPLLCPPAQITCEHCWLKLSHKENRTPVFTCRPQWNDHELFINGSWTVHVQFMNTYSWTVHELSMNMKWPSSWSWWGSWTWSS